MKMCSIRFVELKIGMTGHNKQSKVPISCLRACRSWLYTTTQACRFWLYSDFTVTYSDVTVTLQ